VKLNGKGGCTADVCDCMRGSQRENGVRLLLSQTCTQDMPVRTWSCAWLDCMTSLLCMDCTTQHSTERPARTTCCPHTFADIQVKHKMKRQCRPEEQGGIVQGARHSLMHTGPQGTGGRARWGRVHRLVGLCCPLQQAVA